jgi:hypothetical protein
MTTDDAHDLNRFIRAQEQDYALASPRSARSRANVLDLVLRHAAKATRVKRDGAALYDPRSRWGADVDGPAGLWPRLAEA